MPQLITAEEIISMSKAQRVELYNDKQIELLLLQEHLDSLELISVRQKDLNYTQTCVINMLIKKGVLHNSWVFTQTQMEQAMDLYEGDLDFALIHLVKAGWMFKRDNRYALTKEVRNGTKR